MKADKLTLEVLNRLLIVLNLNLNKTGLYYKHKLRYGDINFFITNNFEKVFRFLELPYTPTNDFESLFMCIINSPYFNIRNFKKSSLANKRYNKFVNYIKNRNPISLYTEHFEFDKNINKISKFFYIDLNSKLNLLEPKGLTSKSIKNKFNGHLVKKWTGIDKGKYLAETIEDFKNYVESFYGMAFLNYIISRKPSAIKSEFEYFFYDNLFLEDSLPY